MSNITDWLLENLDRPRAFEKYVSACCPFHGDRHPSFLYSLNSKYGTCKSCGHHATLAELIQKVTGKPLGEARREARQLASGRGHRSTDRTRHSGVQSSGNTWNSYTPSGSIGDAYWESRCVSEISRLRYRMGYDETKGAVVIPVQTPKGEPAGLIYRYTNPNSFKRYENSPGMEPSKLLWGYHFLKFPKRVYVTEGIIDAVLLNQFGYPAVASLTSSISKDQMKLLDKLGAEICVVADQDFAGLALLDRISSIGYSIVIGKGGFKDVAEMVEKTGTIELEHIPAHCWRSWARKDKSTNRR